MQAKLSEFAAWITILVAKQSDLPNCCWWNPAFLLLPMFKARGWTDTFALQYSRTSALGSKVVGIQRWFTNGFQRFLVGILMVYYISIPVPCRWFILLIYWAFNHHLEGLLTIWTIKIGNITGKWWLIHSMKFKVSTPVRGHARVDILGLGAGGVGWGGMLTFIATATT